MFTKFISFVSISLLFPDLLVNLIILCLLCYVERSFEDNEKTLDELKVLCQRSLLEWSRCWCFTDCSSPSEFMFSLSLVSWVLVLMCCLFFFFLLFIIMNNLYFFFFFFSFIIYFWLPIKKKYTCKHPHAYEHVCMHSSGSSEKLATSTSQALAFLSLSFLWAILKITVACAARKNYLRAYYFRFCHLRYQIRILSYEIGLYCGCEFHGLLLKILWDVIVTWLGVPLLM